MAPLLPDSLSHKLEAWLRYYEDVGIHSFYRDRPLSGQMSSVRAIPSKDAIEREIDSATQPKIESSVSAPLKESPVSHSREESVKKPAKESLVGTEGTVPVQVIDRGPSLFEASQRVVDDTLQRIRTDIGDCTRCKLHRQRHNIVFGVGNPRAELVFVGEGPGHDEDMQGIPFVGRAGQLLTQMIEAMGLRRDDVYIANVVKCRPPENRTPEKDEVATCMPYLFRQLEVVRPKAIVGLGNCAVQALLGTTKGISSFRGRWLDFRGSKLMPTYHPAYLLRNPHAKPEVWDDLKKVMALLGLPLPPPTRRPSRS